SCRLSASGGGRAAPMPGAPAAGLAPESAAIALRIRFRWPNATPNFSRSASVTSGRISKSMEFSAKMVAYCARPILLSQFVISSSTLTVHAHERSCHDISLALKSNALTRSKSLPAWLRQQKCAATLGTPPHRFYPSVPDPSVTAITPEPHKHWQCTIHPACLALC